MQQTHSNDAIRLLFKEGKNTAKERERKRKRKEEKEELACPVIAFPCQSHSQERQTRNQ